MKEIDLIAGIDCETTIKMTIGKKIINHKIVMEEIGHIAETGHTAEIGHKVEIGHEAATTKMTIEMSIRRKIIGI